MFGADVPVHELLGGHLTVEQLAALVWRHQLDHAEPAAVADALDRISQLSDEDVAVIFARLGRRTLSGWLRCGVGVASPRPLGRQPARL